MMKVAVSVFFLLLYPIMTAYSASYSVGCTASTTKVWDLASVYVKPVTSEWSCATAQNEYTSFQLVVIANDPCNLPLNGITVTWTGLYHQNGVAEIPAANIRVRQVYYIYANFPIENGCPDHNWPDPLKELMWVSRLDVEAGKVQPLWVTIYAPFNVLPGKYTGSIHLSCSNGPSKDVLITLRVRDFVLPIETHLKTNFLLWNENISRYCGFPAYSNGLNNVIRKFQLNYLQHRTAGMTPWYGGRDVLHRRQTNGSITLDWAVYDGEVNEAITYGLSNIGIPSPLAQGYWLWDVATNQWVNGTVSPQTPEFEDRIRQCYPQYANHYAEKDWLDKATTYILGETAPNGHDYDPNLTDYEYAAYLLGLIQTAEPRIKKIAARNQPGLPSEFANYVDIWAFDLSMLVNNMSQLDTVRNQGKESWAYYPGAFAIYQPNLMFRVEPWICWKYGMKGFLHTDITAWPASWIPYQMWEPRINSTGDDYILYLNIFGDYGPVDSVRWELWREGLQDYEYFWLLKQKRDQLFAQDPCNALIQQADDALSFDSTMIPNVFFPFTDATAFLQKRQEIMPLIEQINSILNFQETFSDPNVKNLYTNTYNPARTADSIKPIWSYEHIPDGNKVVKIDCADTIGWDEEAFLRNDITLTPKGDFFLQTDIRTLYCANNHLAGLIISETPNPWLAGTKAILFIWDDINHAWSVKSGTAGNWQNLALVAGFKSPWDQMDHLKITRSEMLYTFSVNQSPILQNQLIEGNFRYMGFYVYQWQLGGMCHFDNLQYTNFSSGGPANCEYVSEMGLTLRGDLNSDCYVDLKDVAILGMQWGTCNDPCDPMCTANSIPSDTYFIENFSVNHSAYYTSSRNTSFPGSVAYTWGADAGTGSPTLRADFGSGVIVFGSLIRNDVTLTPNFKAEVDLKSAYGAGNHWVGLIVSESTNPWSTGVKSLILGWNDIDSAWEVWHGTNDIFGGPDIILYGSRKASPAMNHLTIEGNSGVYSFTVDGGSLVSATNVPFSGNFQYVGLYMGAWTIGTMASFDNLQLTGPATIPNCGEVWDRGFGFLGDIDKDCHVDFGDFAILGQTWLQCNKLFDNRCVPNW